LFAVREAGLYEAPERAEGPTVCEALVAAERSEPEAPTRACLFPTTPIAFTKMAEGVLNEHL
jgi:hypothetical protein